MNNKRGYFKRTLSLLLSLLLVLGTFCFFNPFKESVEVAEAATAGSYTWRVRGTSSNDTGGWDKGILRVYGKPNNGTGTQVCIYNQSNMKINWEETNKNWSGNQTTSQYPTRLEYEYSFGGGITHRKMDAWLYIDVLKNGTWTQVLAVQCYSYEWGTNSGTKSGDVSARPAIASVTLSGNGSTTVPRTGTASASTGSATVYDDYGKEWYQEPKYNYSVSAPTGFTYTTSNSDKGVITVDNNAKEWVASNDGSTYYRTINVQATLGNKTSGWVTLTFYNCQYYAIFYNYSITADNKVGSTSEKQRIGAYYKYNTTFNPSSATLDGWVFKGWNTEQKASTGVTSFTRSLTVDVPYYAIYEKNVYAKFNYLDANGNAASTTSANPAVTFTTLQSSGSISESIIPTVPQTITKDGHDWTFVGWRNDTDGATYESWDDINTIYPENYKNGDAQNYYAVYVRSFDLTLDGNGNNNEQHFKDMKQYLNTNGAKSSVTIIYDDIKGYTDSIANATFAGWSDKSTTEYKEVAQSGTSWTFTDDASIYAIYSVDVNFYNEGVKYGSTQTITRGKNATNPAPNYTGDPGFARPTKDCDKEYEYYYTGWDKSLNNITENTDINATYESVLHTYVTTETYATPTCTENGSKAVTCGNRRKDTGEYCYHEIDPLNENLNNITDVDAYGHSWVTTPAKEPTCTTDGYTMQKQCSRCTIYAVDDEGNEIKQTVVPALGHDIDFENDTPIEVFERNCVSDGYKIYKCKRDGCTYTEKVITEKADSTLHNEVEIPAVEVTCTTNGSTAGIICSVCGAIIEQPRTIICEGHKWEVVKAKAATCTEDGCTEGKKCSVCGLVISTSEVIPATGHKLETIEAKDATCTEAGNTAGEVCSVCGEIPEGSTYSVIPALGHEYLAEPVIVKEATCSETGLQRISCKRCGGGEVKEEVIPKLPHTEEEIAAVEATCSSYGYTSGTKCSVCGEIIVAPEKIDKLDHTWEVVEEGYPATCTTDGKTTSFKCSVCGATKGGNVLNKSGHSYGTYAEIAATCEGPGKQYKRCGNCGATTVTESNPLGHNYKEVAAVAATCTTAGTAAGVVCSRCGDIQSGCEVIEATGHNWEEKTVEATCTTDGKVYMVCSVCGAEGETISIIPAHHTEEAVVEVKATCTRSGYTAGTKCSVCGEILSGCERTEPAEHSVYVEKAAKTATCCEAGWTEETRCANCGIVIKKSLSVAQLDHTYSSWTTVKEATCTEGGLKVRYCTVCGELDDEQMTLLPKGHSYSGYATISEPTCTDTGCKQRICKNCGAIEDVAIEAKGHVKKAVSEVAATCTADGHTAGVKCSTCGITLEGIETLPATGHTWEKTSSVEGDCEHNSYDVYTCATCGETENRITKYCTGHESETAPTCKQRCVCDICGLEYGNYGEHNYEAVTTAPTCTKEGYTTYTCTYCGDSYTALPTAATGVHTYVEVSVEEEATCTEDGTKVLKCKTCGETVTETIPAKGHNVTEWTVDGSNCSGTCAECGEVVTRPATDSDYTVCDRCGLKHTRSTGLFKYKGVFCSIRYFFRQIAKLFKK